MKARNMIFQAFQKFQSGYDHRNYEFFDTDLDLKFSVFNPNFHYKEKIYWKIKKILFID